MSSSVFTTDKRDQQEVLEQLIAESKASSDFYLFLIVSAVITTLGLILDNAVVVIGGMLVAPLLYPILFLSMAVTTSSRSGIQRAILTILKSTVVVFVISLVTAFLLNSKEVTGEILMRTEPSLALFLVAFFAGVAAAYGWAKHKISATIAGIAVAVSLIPPLSAFGTGLSLLNRDVVSGSLTLFIINLLGVTLGGILIFLLFGFATLKEKEEEIIKDEKAEEVIQKNAIEESKAEELLASNTILQSTKRGMNKEVADSLQEKEIELKNE